MDILGSLILYFVDTNYLYRQVVVTVIVLSLFEDGLRGKVQIMAVTLDGLDDKIFTDEFVNSIRRVDENITGIKSFGRDSRPPVVYPCPAPESGSCAPQRYKTDDRQSVAPAHQSGLDQIGLNQRGFAWGVNDKRDCRRHEKYEWCAI